MEDDRLGVSGADADYDSEAEDTYFLAFGIITAFFLILTILNNQLTVEVSFRFVTLWVIEETSGIGMLYNPPLVYKNYLGTQPLCLTYIV